MSAAAAQPPQLKKTGMPPGGASKKRNLPQPPTAPKQEKGGKAAPTPAKPAESKPTTPPNSPTQPLESPTKEEAPVAPFQSKPEGAKENGVVAEQDPYDYDVSSSDSEDEGPPPMVLIEREGQDVGALRSSFLEAKNKAKVEKTEITERLGKDSLSSITSAFEKGPESAPTEQRERENLTIVDKEKYSSFKNKFEHIDEEMEKEREAKIAKLRETEEQMGTGKEKHSEILNRFEGGVASDQPEPTPEDKRIEILRTEADKKRVQKTFQKAKAQKEEPKECFVCGKMVYAAEKLSLEGKVFHRPCFKCIKCEKGLSVQNYGTHEGKLYCNIHIKEFFKPGTLGLVDPDAPEEEIQDDEADEDYALVSRPRQLNPDIVRSNTKANEDFAQLPKLGSTKSAWETSAESSGKADRKMELEADLFKEGKVKSRLSKFTDAEKASGSDEEPEPEDDEEHDPNVLREDKKKKKDIIKAEVGSITSRFETGTMERAPVDMENRSSELDEIKKNVSVKERFKEKSGDSVDEDGAPRQSTILAADQIDFSATNVSRDRFLKGDAYNDTPVERTTKDEFNFKEVGAFKEKFEKGQSEFDEHNKEKSETDVIRCAELGNIKDRFEAGEKVDDLTEKTKIEVEDEFRKFKLQRQIQQEKARREAEQAALERGDAPLPEDNPDDVRQSQDMGNIKKRFEEGRAFNSEHEPGKRELDSSLEIKVAGKAREKFKKIDQEGPAESIPSRLSKLQDSKWAKDESGAAPEPINRRVAADNDLDEGQPEDYEVKNLLSKFSNLANKDDSEESKGPKPKRQITPPPSGYRAEIENEVAELDPSVVRGGEDAQSGFISADAKNLRAKFEAHAAGEDVPGETAEEKRKRLEKEFQMYKEMKEQQREAEPDEPDEPESREKEELGIAAEHAQKMKKKFEKINKKQAKKAEKGLRKQVPTVDRTMGPVFCHACQLKVFMAEKMEAHLWVYHRLCYRCKLCGVALRPGHDAAGPDGCYCLNHYRLLFNNMARSSYEGREGRTMFVK